MKLFGSFYLLIGICIGGVFTSPTPSKVSDGNESSKTEGSCSVKDIEASMYLAKVNSELSKYINRDIEAMYVYNTNVTEKNRKAMIDAKTQTAEFHKIKAKETLDLGYQFLKDEEISRKVKWLTKLDYNILSEEDGKELLNAISRMQSNYAKVRVTSFKDPTKNDLSLEPDIQERIRNSRDPEELKYYWKEWYDKAGTPARKDFEKYIEIGNKSANLNDFVSQAESWISKYEDEDFEKNLEKTFEQILPFYKQVHGYVRHKLRQHYGDHITENGNIPIHLLGNLWGQAWDGIIDLLTPFPDKPFVDVTAEMKRQGYTPLKIFQMGDEFFQSLNMTKLPDAFWSKSVLEKPNDRDIICHASAWDLFVKDDVRIKQCTEVTMEHLYIVHHELGHIQYYLQYQDQPLPFRFAPNPGFHEAVGDVIALSVSTPKHLAKIGLSDKPQLDEESRINELFKTALKKIVFLPFAYIMDKYRYEVFKNQLKPENWNCGWWKMRSQYSGLEPPLERTENDFDPPAKYHIDADVEYLRYFCSHIFQFQFHKAMCQRAGQYIKGSKELTLDNCDIHGNAEAGNAFKAMLHLGSSKPWKDVLEPFTGDRELNAGALLEYFEPLILWLEAENKRLNVSIGWNISNKCN